MTEPIDGSEHLSRDAAGRLRYTPPVRSLRPWSTLVILLIAVTTVIEMIPVVAIRLGIEMALLADAGWAATIGVSLAQTITLATVWCLWQHAAASNLAKRSPTAQRFSPAQGVWSWFIPFINFVRPAYVILDLWRGSEALVACDGPRRPPSGAGVVVVVIWWVAQFAPILMLPFWVFLPAAPSVADPAAMLAQFAFPAVHATLACVIVHRITRMQDAWPPGDADADAEPA